MEQLRLSQSFKAEKILNIILELFESSCDATCSNLFNVLCFSNGSRPCPA